jgi:hypothetical protein
MSYPAHIGELGLWDIGELGLLVGGPILRKKRFWKAKEENSLSQFPTALKCELRALKKNPVLLRLKRLHIYAI